MIRHLLSRSVLLYLRFWAKIALAIHTPQVIGIAGSAGKSSAKHALTAALTGHVHAKTLKGNSETGVPLSILGIKPDGFGIRHWCKMLFAAPFGLWSIRGYEYLIIEMGIDSPHWPKNMEYLLSIVKPDIAISLNISGTHTMEFEDILPARTMTAEEKMDTILHAMAKEDTKIITQSGCTSYIYNADDPYITQALEEYTETHTQSGSSFGENRNNTLSYAGYTASLDATEFAYELHTDTGTQAFSLTFENMLLPQVYKETFAAAILAAREADISVEHIVTSLSTHFSLPKGRSSLFSGIHNSIIIDSSYNASKAPMLTFIDMAKELGKNTGRPVVVIFGDMRELGEEAQQEHEEVAHALNGIAHVYCVGQLTQRYVMPHLPSAESFMNSYRLGEHLKQHLPQDSIVLVKGSQNTIYLEETVKALLADDEDAAQLCRQEPYWLKIKSQFFQDTQK